jgi:hypothetical protein
LVKEKLKLNILPTDISTAHRIGRKPVNQQPDKRNIILKLCRRDIKRDLLYACRQLKPDIYINENLTPARNTILYVLRKLKRAHADKVLGCSSIDGRVYALVKTPGTAAENNTGNTRKNKIFINCHGKLIDFCSNHVNKPLSDFLESWSH